ncbi:MAG: hypothetical protein IKB52_02705 [Kiritimatiellae bacterium]|nr:hypothetical protein [Kiritimatiellia bacterium]
MNIKTAVAAMSVLASTGAFADFNINLDLSGKPMRDLSKTTSKAIVGYISAMHAYGDDYWFVTNKYETAAVMKKAGCYNTATWSSDMWFARRNDPDPKKRTNPKAQFDFWKQNGFKVLIGLSPIGPKQAADEKVFKSIVDDKVGFVKWIIDNGYKDVVQGFELGCETYYMPYDRQDALIKLWTALVPEILKIWPKCPMGVPVAENFELNPDIKQVRNRMLAAGEIKRDTYFAAAAFNQYSAYFIMGLATNNVLDKISHVTYHTYGAETPYSCSYYGVKRIRGFAEAFPEIKGKRTWWTEIRPRSDEDNRCQRIFREALIMGHYSLMMMCQPEVDGFYHHNLCNLAGGLYISNGKSWNVQWMDEGGEYPDYDSPLGRPRMEVGAQGAVYHIIANALISHPLLWHHGTSKDMDTEDSFYTSARVCDQVYERRKALKAGVKAPEVPGEVEWAALTKGNELCLVMVNTKSTAEKIQVTVPGRQFAAPTYRIARIKDPKYIDCREVPGEASLWEVLAYEDTQTGFAGGGAYEGPKSGFDTLKVEIGPHTAQSVTVVMRNAPKK